MKIVGIVLSAGEFEGRKYDNVNIHCIEEPSNHDKCVGMCCVVTKVKRDLFNTCVSPYMSSGVGAAQYVDLIGMEIEFSYNRFAQVQSVSIS